MEAIREAHLHSTVTRPEAFRMQLLPAQAGKMWFPVHVSDYTKKRKIPAQDRTDINQVQ